MAPPWVRRSKQRTGVYSEHCCRAHSVGIFPLSYNLKMQTLYNEFGKYFDIIASASSVDTQKEAEFLDGIFSQYGIESVLDIACGTGRHSIALAKIGYEVVGIDYAGELLKVARSKESLQNLQFIRQDVSKISLDQTVDAAICMWSTFGELPYKEMLSKLKNVIKPDGVFIIDTTYFSSMPTGTAHKSYVNTTDGVKVVTEIDERYEGIKRIREVTNIVDGQELKDHSEMDVLTEADFIELLSRYDFEHQVSYYDYSPEMREETKRIQLVFQYKPTE